MRNSIIIYLVKLEFVLKFLLAKNYFTLSINYVVLAGGEGGKPKDDLLNRPYLINKTIREGGVQKLPILRKHNL